MWIVAGLTAAVLYGWRRLRSRASKRNGGGQE